MLQTFTYNLRNIMDSYQCSDRRLMQTSDASLISGASLGAAPSRESPQQTPPGSARSSMHTQGLEVRTT